MIFLEQTTSDTENLPLFSRFNTIFHPGPRVNVVLISSNNIPYHFFFLLILSPRWFSTICSFHSFYFTELPRFNLLSYSKGACVRISRIYSGTLFISNQLPSLAYLFVFLRVSVLRLRGIR